MAGGVRRASDAARGKDAAWPSLDYMRPCFSRPRAQARLPLAGFRHLVQSIDRPGQPEGPVAIVDGRGLVDPIAPAEDVLHRKQHQIGTRRQQHLEQRVAHGRSVDVRHQHRRIGRRPPAVGSAEICRRSSAACHPTRPPDVSVSCVPETATDSAGYPDGSRNGWPSPCQWRSHRNTRNPGTPSRASDARTKSGTMPRSSAMTCGAGFAEDCQHAFAERDLIGLVRRREERLAVSPGPPVRPVEADEVVDAVAVVRARRSAVPALAQPPEIVGRDDVPAIDRHAPVLAGGAERVGRRADRGVETELVLPGPDVGAVAVHHERQIAEQRHAVGLRPRLLPLRRAPATAGTDGRAPRSRARGAHPRALPGSRRRSGSGHSVQGAPSCRRESPGTARSRRSTRPVRPGTPRTLRRDRCRGATPRATNRSQARSKRAFASAAGRPRSRSRRLPDAREQRADRRAKATPRRRSPAPEARLM